MDRDSLLLDQTLTQTELLEILKTEGYQVSKLGSSLEVKFPDFSVFIYLADFEGGSGLYFNLTPRGLGQLKVLNPWYRKVALAAAGAYKEDLVSKLSKRLITS